MDDSQLMFVWGGSWKALSAEIRGMIGRLLGTNTKLYITDVLPRVECANLAEGVGVLASVFTSPVRPGVTSYGRPWNEPTYRGEPRSTIVVIHPAVTPDDPGKKKDSDSTEDVPPPSFMQTVLSHGG